MIPLAVHLSVYITEIFIAQIFTLKLRRRPVLEKIICLVQCIFSRVDLIPSWDRNADE